MKNKKQKLELSLEIFSQLSKLIIAAFGLVAALAWNDVIKSVFDLYFPSPKGNILAQFIYALFVTILIVIITVLLARSTKKIKDSLKNK